MTDKDLHAYQQAMREHIRLNTHAGLFMQMGLGKTVTTLTAFNDLKFDDMAVGKALIIAPKRVAEQVWAFEVAKWEHLKHLRVSVITGTEKQRLAALKVDADLYTISRDNVAWLFGLWNYNYSPFDMLIIDELSSFKNHASNRFTALRKVQPCFKRVVGLTGTPSPNSLLDLWAQVYLLDRGERLGKTLGAYRERYFTHIRKGQFTEYKVKDFERDHIYEVIGDIVVSMKAEDYITMPDLIINDVRLDLPPKVRKAYDDFERNMIIELIESGEEISVASASALTNKLLQFAGGAVYDEERNVHKIHEVKLEALEEIVSVANGAPVLVAWAYQHERDRIMRRLRAYKPRELKSNDDIAAWNAGEINVLLMHPASGGHGLNLQGGGNIIVWYGNSWSLELYEQFNARLHRQGQQAGRVIVNRLVCTDTEDESVISALDRKQEGQNHLMDAVKAKIDKHRLYYTS